MKVTQKLISVNSTFNQKGTLESRKEGLDIARNPATKRNKSISYFEPHL